MGIEASYRRLPPEEFEHLCRDPDLADTYFGLDIDLDDDDALDSYSGALASSGRYLDIGKDWQGLHFLLTGRAEMDATEVPPPLGSVVLGGTPTEWEATYGMVRYLAPAEVEAVALTLDAIGEAQLRPRLDVEAFRKANIYPGGPCWDAQALEHLLRTYARVRAFFAAAAREGEVVLLSSD